MIILPPVRRKIIIKMETILDFSFIKGTLERVKTPGHVKESKTF